MGTPLLGSDKHRCAPAAPTHDAHRAAPYPPGPPPLTPQPGRSGRPTRPAGEGPLFRAQRGPLPPAVPPLSGPSPAGPEPLRLKEAAPGTYVVSAAVGAEVADGTERVARDGSRHDEDHCCRRQRSHKAERARRPPTSGGARGLLGDVVSPRAGWPGNHGVFRGHPRHSHQRQAVSVSTTATRMETPASAAAWPSLTTMGILPEV